MKKAPGTTRSWIRHNNKKHSGNSNGDDDKTWSPPKMQAPSADPQTAVRTRDWTDEIDEQIDWDEEFRKWSNTGGPPKVQASWADPPMAAGSRN
jgi:hypothetical protein